MNKKTIFKLRNINGLNFIPILLRFSIVSDLEALINPFLTPSSKHPLTVSVSKPNGYNKI